MGWAEGGEWSPEECPGEGLEGRGGEGLVYAPGIRSWPPSLAQGHAETGSMWRDS